jgi:hypothetical protein
MFDLFEFIAHPMQYLPPMIDAWVREWGNFLDAFVATNPWFCTFMSGTGMTWITWLVMKTPWNWDNNFFDWFSKVVLKRPTSVAIKKEERSENTPEV